MDGGYTTTDASDPLAGWRDDADLLKMLHIENGMQFPDIAALISEGLGVSVRDTEVEEACLALRIVTRPTAATPSTPAVSMSGIDPHEPIGCRWISGDTRGTWAYCRASQRDGSSYCSYHHGKAYQHGTAAEAMRKSAQRRLDKLAQRAGG